MEKFQDASHENALQRHGAAHESAFDNDSGTLSASPPPFQLQAGTPAVEVRPTTNTGSGVAMQRQEVRVGYDGQDNQLAFAGPGDSLHTVGVMNCIAVVAYDTGKKGAVMRHYDTRHCFADTENDDVSGRNALVWNPEAIQALKAEVDAALGSHVQGANIAYKISLGALWHNLDPRDAQWKSRHNLITGLKDVFGVEAERGGSTASYDVDSNSLSA